MPLHKREIPEKVPTEYEYRYPTDTTDNIIADEFQIGHFADAGDKRCERSNYRHKTCDNNSLAAVLFIELMRTFQVLFFEKPDIFFLEYPWADIIANPVINGIAQYCGDRQDNEQPGDIQGAPRSKRSRCK